MKKSHVIYWCVVALTVILFLGSGYMLFIKGSSGESSQQSAMEDALDDGTEESSEDLAYRMYRYEEQALARYPGRAAGNAGRNSHGRRYDKFVLGSKGN